MLQPGNGSSFEFEAINELLVESGVWGENFNSHITVNIFAVAFVYRRHPALTEQFGDLIHP
jgi:hypothetical protein